MNLKEQSPLKEVKVEKSNLMGAKPTQTAKPFDDLKPYCEEGNPALTEIVVRSGAIIDNITFVYGKKHYSHGGNGGSARKFVLERDEFIVAVKGTHTRFCNMDCISSLSFTTSNGRDFSVGNAGPANKFEFRAPKAMQICAIFGNADKFLNNIGFYAVEPPKDMKSMFGK